MFISLFEGDFAAGGFAARLRREWNDSRLRGVIFALTSGEGRKAVDFACAVGS
jgi:hypothetical protein